MTNSLIEEGATVSFETGAQALKRRHRTGASSRERRAEARVADMRVADFAMLLLVVLLMLSQLHRRQRWL